MPSEDWSHLQSFDYHTRMFTLPLKSTGNLNVWKKPDLASRGCHHRGRVDVRNSSPPEFAKQSGPQSIIDHTP